MDQNYKQNITANNDFLSSLLNDNIKYFLSIGSLPLLIFNLFKISGFVQSFFFLKSFSYKLNQYRFYLLLIITTNIFICLLWLNIAFVISSRYLYLAGIIFLILAIPCFIVTKNKYVLLFLIIYSLFFTIKNFKPFNHEISINNYLESHYDNDDLLVLDTKFSYYNSNAIIYKKDMHQIIKSKKYREILIRENNYEFLIDSLRENGYSLKNDKFLEERKFSIYSLN